MKKVGGPVRPGTVESRLDPEDIKAMLPWLGTEDIDDDEEESSMRLMSRVEVTGFEWGVVILAKLARAGLLKPGADPGEEIDKLLKLRSSGARVSLDPSKN
jgi:hypothetical protein